MKCVSIVISIGFQFEQYTFFEPQFDATITNVTLIKEGGRITEQILGLQVTYTAGTASFEVDYTLGFFFRILNEGISYQMPRIQPSLLFYKLTRF